jgi:hypothetical protein
MKQGCFWTCQATWGTVYHGTYILHHHILQTWDHWWWQSSEVNVVAFITTLLYMYLQEQQKLHQCYWHKESGCMQVPTRNNILILPVFQTITEWRENYWITNCKGCGRNQLCHNLRYTSGILEGLKNYVHFGSLNPTANLNETPPIYKSGLILPEPTNMRNDVTKYLLWFIAKHSSLAVSWTEYRRL